jgi:hypothetical protein
VIKKPQKRKSRPDLGCRAIGRKKSMVYVQRIYVMHTGLPNALFTGINKCWLSSSASKKFCSGDNTSTRETVPTYAFVISPYPPTYHHVPH